MSAPHIIHHLGDQQLSETCCHADFDPNVYLIFKFNFNELIILFNDVERDYVATFVVNINSIYKELRCIVPINHNHPL